MSVYYRMDGWVRTALGAAVSGAQVYVCTQPANTGTIPPSPLATIYSDSAGLNPIIQPIVCDGLGHYCFYALSGQYTIVIVNQGLIQAVYPDQLVGII